LLVLLAGLLLLLLALMSLTPYLLVFASLIFIKKSTISRHIETPPQKNRACGASARFAPPAAAGWREALRSLTSFCFWGFAVPGGMMGCHKMALKILINFQMAMLFCTLGTKKEFVHAEAPHHATAFDPIFVFGFLNIRNRACFRDLKKKVPFQEVWGVFPKSDDKLCMVLYP
jgi:hypothetical protein